MPAPREESTTWLPLELVRVRYVTSPTGVVKLFFVVFMVLAIIGNYSILLRQSVVVLEQTLLKCPQGRHLVLLADKERDVVVAAAI